jgi:hypothetical protein
MRFLRFEEGRLRQIGDLVGDWGRVDFSALLRNEAKATAKAKCGGLSTTRRMMKLSVASVEMTLSFGEAKK